MGNSVLASYLLCGLRNSLVHYKPLWDIVDEQRGKQSRGELEQKLNDRFQLSPWHDSSEDFVTMRCMGAGCTQWAVKTAFSFIREFDSRSHLDDDKMRGFWLLDEEVNKTQ